MSLVQNLVSKASGNSDPANNPGIVAGLNDSVNKQLGVASTQAQGTNNNTASNADAGYEQYQSSPNGPDPTNGQYGPDAPVKTDLNRIIPENSEYNTFKVVGTSVNYTNPINNLPPDTLTKGTPSLFNDYWLVSYQGVKDRVGNTTKPPSVTNLGDEKKYKGLGDHEEYKNPTTSKIIKVFNGQNPDAFYSWPEKKYTYSDFLYLKHYHPYNNNRLITLRRFMNPVYDNCRSAIRTANTKEGKIRAPIAKALSYLGTSDNKLSALTNFTVSINTTNVTGNQSDSPTMLGKTEFANIGKFFNKDSKNTQDDTNFGVALLAVLNGSTEETAPVDKWATAMNMWESGPYEDLIYGPVNAIIGSKTRTKGLTYTHAINLNFEYSTKYIERINPKAAMLDIVSNMLAMTYHHANFFGGENRFIFDKTNFPFLDNEVEAEFIKKLGKGNAEEAMKEYAKSLADKGSNITATMKDLIEGIAKDGIKSEAVKGIVAKALNISTALNNSLQSKNKQITSGTKSTLNGSPTGTWHLQIGNPFNPIMMLGNLWCTSGTFTFNDDLSADDFPTELKVGIKLEYGRQRDSSDIQSMFNAGGGRIYYPYQNMDDTNASSTFYNTEYIYNDKPSQNKNAYQAVTGVQSATTQSTDLGTEKTKLEPKVDKTNVERVIFMPQNQPKVDNNGDMKK
jgi:hypothetical protein